jgi:hypothetical protein
MSCRPCLAAARSGQLLQQAPLPRALLQQLRPRARRRRGLPRQAGLPPAAAPKGQEVEAQKSNRDGEAAQDDQDNPVPRTGDLGVLLELIRLELGDLQVLVGEVELGGHQGGVGVDHEVSGFII